MYARAAPPGRAGIALVALNGGQNVENANGLTVARLPDAESTALRFNFAVGQAPFLVIPQSGRTIALRQGGAVAVNWSSNRRQKNEGTAPKYAGFRPPTSHVAVLYPDLTGGGIKMWICSHGTGHTDHHQGEPDLFLCHSALGDGAGAHL